MTALVGVVVAGTIGAVLFAYVNTATFNKR